MQRSNVEIINPLSIQGVMPVMEGFVVSFSCCSEFILAGPNSSTCMSNGEWEPDPREVECRQKGPFHPRYLITKIINSMQSALVNV